MKHLKTLVIAVLGAAAILAVVGASAAEAETILCTEKASVCPQAKADGVGTEIKMSLVSGTESNLTTGLTGEQIGLLRCGKSSITAKVTNVGTNRITASIEGLTFEACFCEVKVLLKGELELERIAGTENATVISTGTELTANCSTMFGSVHCIYQTVSTKLGTLEGGNPARFKSEGSEIPRVTTNSLCSSEAKWDAEYEVSTPKPLYVEPEEAIKETVLCTEQATPCPAGKADGTGTEIKTSLVSGAKSKLTTPYNNIECGKSTLNATVTSVAEHTSASVGTLSFEECNCEVKVLQKGTLDLRYIKNTDNATVKSNGTEITTLCSTAGGNVHCIYKTEATDLGTLEGGSPAKIKIAGAEIPRLATDSRCNEGTSGTKWDAEYEVTSPKPLYVEPEARPGETVLCAEAAAPCPAGKVDGIGTEVTASSLGISTLTTTFKNIECSKSSLTAKVTSTGKTIGATVEGLTFESCNCEVKVIQNGTLELEHIASTANATTKSASTESTTTCSTIFGNVHCIYKTEATDLGPLEGGNPAKIKISSVNVPRLATNGLCSEKALWDVEYEVTSPKPLYIEPE